MIAAGVTFFCFGVALLLLWLPRARAVAYGLFVVALVAAFYARLMEPAGALAVGGMAALLALKRGSWRWVGAGVAALLSLHWLPGFMVWYPLDPIRFTPDATPYLFHFYVDKAAMGFLLLFTFATLGSNWKAVFRAVALYLPLTILIMLGPGLFLGQVAYSPKLPAETPLFVVTNLLFVCAADAALFRGVIQRELTRLWGALPAILLTGVAFGLYHYQSGPIMIVLSTIAGILFGLAYQRSGERIESAIVVHFGFNITHFLLFTYPAIAGSA